MDENLERDKNCPAGTVCSKPNARTPGLWPTIEWDFPEITLYEFDLTCPPPILAHTDSGGQLVLHTGPNAHLREEINTDDNDETIVVQHLGGTSGNEKVMV